ncbi:hypothetical protein [Streptomyces sp. NPDC053069]|uniref:hypothetical protein n=1 Tax=Streptomyces sp. NPDC053069 TaxID=3365695 RepID=UPI0037CD758E
MTKPSRSIARRVSLRTLVDEIQTPLRHRTRVSVFNFRNGEEGGTRKEEQERKK